MPIFSICFLICFHSIFSEVQQNGCLSEFFQRHPMFCSCYFIFQHWLFQKSLVKNKNNYQYASLGASGAVAAVNANIFFDPFGMMSFYFIPMPKFVFGIFYIMICIYMDRQRMDNVNHSAHLWGAVYGFFFPLLVQPNLIHFFIGHFGYAMN